MLIHHGHDSKRPEKALDQDVHGEHERGQAPAIGEHEPPEQVGVRGALAGLGAHRPNPISTAPITIEATAQRANIVKTMSLGGTGLSSTLRWMITPANLRNVQL